MALNIENDRFRKDFWIENQIQRCSEIFHFVFSFRINERDRKRAHAIPLNMNDDVINHQ